MGRVFVLDKEFLTIKNEATDELGHKFFDSNTPKTLVDIPFIDNCFLTEREISEKKWIADMANSGELPSQISDVYKTIAPKDKYYLFQSVKRKTEQKRRKCVVLFHFIMDQNILRKVVWRLYLVK